MVAHEVLDHARRRRFISISDH